MTQIFLLSLYFIKLHLGRKDIAGHLLQASCGSPGIYPVPEDPSQMCTLPVSLWGKREDGEAEDWGKTLQTNPVSCIMVCAWRGCAVGGGGTLH